MKVIEIENTTQEFVNNIKNSINYWNKTHNEKIDYEIIYTANEIKIIIKYVF